MRWLVCCLLAACAPEAPGPTAACDGLSDSHVAVMSEIRVAREVDGVSRGFDLDGQDGVCGVQDYTHPDGTEGIDNALAGILPALELTEAQALEALIDEQIKNGALVLLVELADLDDSRSDDCVDVRLWRGDAAPLLGNDGELLWGQTLPVASGAPGAAVDGVPLRGGELVASPVQLRIPISVFGYTFDVTLADAVIEVKLAADGSLHGWIGGAVDVEEIRSFADVPAVDPGVLALLDTLLAASADLRPDPQTGVCGAMSVTLRFEAVPAHLFGER